MALAPRWLRARTGVRVASALSAAAAVALALVVAGAALILLVGHSLSRSVQDDAVQQAEAIAQRMHGNYGKRVDGQFTPKENAVEAIDTLVGSGDPAVAQIVVDYSPDQDGDGWALQTGSDDATPLPISDLTPDPGQLAVDPSALVQQTDGTTMHAVLVAVGGATTTDDPMHFVVLYAAPLAAVDAAQDTVLYYLLFGVPILILIAGAATYVFAGRALRPVEAIRTRVASMSEKDLSKRVPVPAARDEVGRLAETMNAMIGRLENAQGVQRRFVADASHELRSPLATIGAGLELLQDREPETVTALLGETERLGRLVDDLLLLARADERGMQPRQDEVDLDEIVEAERTRPPAGEVRTEVRAEHVRVVGDRGQLVRVLRNLVDNAHRHARSRVVVTLARSGGQAALDVADDGPGVPKADRTRIFERFVRLDDARARADGGSGLGLAIVAEVVAAHDGQVWVDDAAEGGAVFRVRLPAAELPAEDAAEDFADDDASAWGAAAWGDATQVDAASATAGRVNGTTADRAPATTPASVAGASGVTNGPTAAPSGGNREAPTPAGVRAAATPAGTNGPTAAPPGGNGAAPAPAGVNGTTTTAAHVNGVTAMGASSERAAVPHGTPPGAGAEPTTTSGTAPGSSRGDGSAPSVRRVARRGPEAWAPPPSARADSDDMFSDWVPPQPPEPASPTRPSSPPGTRPLPVVDAGPARPHGGWRVRITRALGRRHPDTPQSSDAAPVEVPRRR